MSILECYLLYVRREATKALRDMFGLASRRKKSNEPADLYVVDPSKFEVNGRGVTIEGRAIDYRDVVQAILNVDTTPGDGIGGSMFLKTVPSKDNPAREVKLYNFTFGEDGGVERAKAVFDAFEKFGIRTRYVSGKDSMFRDMFFVHK